MDKSPVTMSMQKQISVVEKTMTSTPMRLNIDART